MKSDDLPHLLLAMVVLIVVVLAVSGTAADPDLWGHVRFGQDILAARAIPRHDTYSFTSDRPWINHEWLAEVLMAGAYGLAGSAGLSVLKCLLATIALAILWKALRHAGVFQPFTAGLVLLATVGSVGLVLTVRPQSFSMLLFAILLALLNSVGRRRWRLLLWMPLLFAFWANLHGGWIVGLGVLGLWSGGALLARIVPWSWALGGPILGLVGTLATPYGVGLWEFLWRTVGLGRADITEWQPLTTQPALLIPWAAFASLIVVAWLRRRSVATAQMAPLLVLGLSAFRVSRLGGFFALATVTLLAPCFSALGPPRLPLSRRPTRSEVLLTGIICLAALAATGLSVSRNATCVTLGDSELTPKWVPEAEAVTFLKINELQGRLLTYFDYGEMAIWHLAPKLLVSYDGRRETVYSEKVRDAHERFYSSKTDASYARLLKADYIWLPRRLPVIAPLERDGWVAIFRGPRSVVLARQAGPYAQPAPWTGPRCFPGP